MEVESETVEVVLHEICVKTEAKPPYELTAHIATNQPYKSAYGDRYPRTVFVERDKKITRSISSRIKNYFVKSKNKIVDSSLNIKDKKNDKVDADIKICLGQLNTVKVGDKRPRIDSDNAERYVINPVTKEKQKLYLVNSFSFIIVNVFSLVRLLTHLKTPPRNLINIFVFRTDLEDCGRFFK